MVGKDAHQYTLGDLMRKQVFTSLSAMALVGALVLAGCSSDAAGGGSDGGENAGTAAVAPGTAAEITTGYFDFGNTEGSGGPVTGGTFTFAYTGSILSFDPATQQYSGTSGGNEAAAVYGVLSEYDSEAGKYVPAMAESVKANDDFTLWTIGLRDGVMFTDGTPYDAEAVKFNLDRVAESGKGWSTLWKQMVSSVTVKDPKTVEVKLNSAWADFQFLLSQAPGMIASPTVVQTEGENYLNQPVGAGPFVLKSWTPGQSLEVIANDDYWDGRPNLDSVIFQTVTGGDQAASDALLAGNAQGSYTGNIPVALEWLDPANGLNGYARVANTSAVLLMNNGTPGNPDASAKDINVRRAIAQAMDTTVIDQRADDGLGLPNSGMVVWDAPSIWQNDDPGLKFDLDAAKASLKKAKADGFDGKLDLLYQTTGEQAALTVQALLQTAGFEVSTTPTSAIGDIITRVLVNKDYDLAMYGWPVPDEPGELFTSYLGRFGVEGNPTGFYSESLEDALKSFAATDDQEEKKAKLADVQAEFTKDVPAVPLGGGIGVVTWAGNVHGITVSSRVTLDFSKAWIEG